MRWAKVSSTTKKRWLKSWSVGRGRAVCWSRPSVCFRLLFASSFPSPLLFPSWFLNLFHRFVFILPRTFKNNYWNHSSPSESFLRHGMNYTAGQTSEGRGPLPARREGLLRVALVACANGDFVVQLPACADTQRRLPSFTYVRVWGLWKWHSLLITVSQLLYKLCKRISFCSYSPRRIYDKIPIIVTT